MSKTLSLGALGLLSAGLLLITPQQSQAQGFGISLNFGRGGFSYYNDPGCHYDAYRYPYTGSSFNSYYNSGYGHRGYGYSGYGYGGHGYGHRPIIVHPETQHWTPARGWHSHGHIHVPSRFGYRAVPY